MIHVRLVLAKVAGTLQDYRTVMSGEGGRFSFRDLTPGSHRLYAEQAGYLPTEYGQHTLTPALNPMNANGITISVAAGQDLKDLTLTMIPLGTIAGSVTDDNRNPMPHVLVRALKATYRDGERTLTNAGYAESNDLGEYRVFDLAPGFYFVEAVPPEHPHIEGDTYVVPLVPSNANNNRSSIRTAGEAAVESGDIDPRAFARHTDVPVYYPGTPDSQFAVPVDVRPGETSVGIDMVMKSLPAVRIRGTLTNGMSGQPAPPAVINLMRRGGAQPNAGSVQVNMGQFEFTSIPAGDYDLSAQTTIPQQRLFARVPVTVGDHDLDNITVVLQPGVTLTGRITTEGNAPATNGSPARAAIVLYPGYSLPPLMPDGRFVIRDVQEGDYTVRLLAPATAYVKRAEFGSVDALQRFHVDAGSRNQLLEIVLSYNTGSIDATVIDERQQPVGGIIVTAVPDASRRNRSDLYHSATSDAFGHARIVR